MNLNNEQQLAVSTAIAKKFVGIVGGAGTGKTTIIKEIYLNVDGCILLCPTGKAAARLREATGLQAYTIHSFLGYDGTRFFKQNLSEYAVIIDESSMIDSWLMYEIFKRRPKKLVLVGDSSQIFPVGPGQPFHDLVELFYGNPFIVELVQCYRNSEAIYKAATKIRNAEMPDKIDRSENESWEVRHTGDSDKTLGLIGDMIRAGQIDFEQDVIIAAKNVFVDQVNELATKILFPDIDQDKEFFVGQRIICTKNFSKQDIWNGTTGTITGIDAGGNAFVRGDVPFNVGTNEINDQDEILFSRKTNLKFCRPAYALTVHKSQGSQYRNVIFCVFQDDAFSILSRSLIYTAVTRAKNSCLVIGDSRTFYQGISVSRRRNTVMQELVKQQQIKSEGES